LTPEEIEHRTLRRSTLSSPKPIPPVNASGFQKTIDGKFWMANNLERGSSGLRLTP